MTSKEIIKKLTQDGWYHVKTVGDHHHFKHAAKPGKVTVPHPVKDMPLVTIKYIERQSGLKLK